MKIWFPFCYTLQETKISEQHSNSNSQGGSVHVESVGIQNTPLGKDQKSDEVLQKSGSGDSENGNSNKNETDQTSNSIANGVPYDGYRNGKIGENTNEKENFGVNSTQKSSAKFVKSKKEPEINVQHDITYAGVESGKNQIPDRNHVDGGAEETSKRLKHSRADSS